MPIQLDNANYDFEITFEKNCNINNVITYFFNQCQIKGDKEYIAYKIKKLIEEDRNCLTRLHSEGPDPFNRIGKISYLRHYVNPEQNNGKECYVYCINTFI